MKLYFSFLFIAGTLLFSKCKAQIAMDDNFLNLYGSSRVKAAQSLKNTTLLVVIDSESSEIGKQYSKAFDQYWKYTPFKFIKPGEVNQYINDEKYSFFVFAERDLNNGGIGLASSAGGFNPSGTGISIKRTWVISSDSTPNSKAVNNYYLYVILLGKNSKKDNMNFDKLYAAEYEIMGTSVYGSPYNDLTLRQIQMKSIQCIPMIVNDIQAELNFIVENNEVQSLSYSPEKVIVKHESKEVKCRTTVYLYSGAKKELKSKKILIDSTLADNMSVQYLAKITDVDVHNIQLTGMQSINDEIAKNSDNVLYVRELCGSTNGASFYRVCDTKGIKVADFSGTVMAITEGSIFNPKEVFSTELFNKRIDPENRVKNQIILK